jgi:selenide,water dikinase
LQEIVSLIGKAPSDPNLLVGFETSDDAGVYRLSEDVALVQTLDFITPVVDDPFVFGQVAAANSLSDVFAMGGRPLTAMNICCFPGKGIPNEDLARILEGALERVRAAGAVMVGGHTVQDDELKFGLSVTGIVNPARLLTNAGAKPGDGLILTKPIGVGIIVTGHGKGLAGDDLLERAVRRMVALNDCASRAALDHGANGATDITGFGLAGHAMELARASGVGLSFRYGSIPLYPEALPLITRQVTTANTCTNRDMVAPFLTFEGEFTDEEQTILFDPQTSGGLLISLPAGNAEACLRAIRAGGDEEAELIGEVVATDRPFLRVTR